MTRKITEKLKLFLFGTILIFLSFLVSGSQPLPNWEKELRKTHPRLLLNSDDLPKIREMALTKNLEHYQQLRNFAYKKIELEKLELFTERFTIENNGKIKLAKGFNQGPEVVRNTGMKEASAAAMVFLISQDEKDKQRALELLELSNKYMEYCLKVDLPVDYHTEFLMDYMCSYDWMYNHLSREQQIRIGKNIAEYVQGMQPDGRLKVFKSTGDIESGFYGSYSMLLPAGIVLYGNGIDDQLAEEFLNKGYDLYLGSMEFRDEIAGDKGLLIASTPTYSFGAYPLATFLFFHMNKAALNKDLTLQYTHMVNFINWFLWSTIPDGQGLFYHYGIGDVRHNNNRFDQSAIYGHFSQIVNFYAKTRPDVAKKAQSLIDTLPEDMKKFNDWHPFMSMLMTNKLDAPNNITVAQLTANETAEFFPIFGLVFMRSGYTSNDTFAVFRSGSKRINHQHFDENHFVIYRRGFLALDSGNRGMAQHHNYYYPQTVAHNAILIDHPTEPMPNHWYGWPPSMNNQMVIKDMISDGGQYDRRSGEMQIFETSPDFTWVSGDATKTYIAEKAKLVEREFVYLPPHVFVVYDKVVSTKSQYTKRFILHTQNEPFEYKSNWLAANSGEGGQLRWSRILPEQGKTQIIGGPGKQFFTKGRNFPLEQGEAAFDSPNYYGQWRYEFTAPSNKTNTEFLYVLHAALPEDKEIEVTKIVDANSDGVIVKINENTSYKLIFNKDKSGGYIEKTEENKVILTKEIKE